MTADDSRLRVLAALARKMSHTESARRDAASFEKFEQRLEARQGRRLPWGRVLMASTALAAAALVAWPRPHDDAGEALPQLRFAVHALPTTDQAAARSAVPAQETVAAPAGQRLAFTDGSEVQLTADAAANVAELTPRGARVQLKRGVAEVSIVRRKQAAWSFQAGPYTVRVTGTAFKLAWSDELQQIEVGMHHGSVIVIGPSAPSGVALRAGQRLVASARTHRLVVEDWTPAVASADPSAIQLPALANPAPPDARESRARQRTPRESASSERDWAKKVAQGDFATVLREAKALGHARLLGNAHLSDLSALADAARYARQTQLGRSALVALRTRFPESESGRDAAFFLGRLSGGKDALKWYDRYLTEQPNGQYASQALGRSMMLHYERDEAERAAELGREYLRRFAEGPYATSARKLSQPVRVTSPTP
jgi:hypothetical protein